MRMGISDLIAGFLQDCLDEAENGVLEVQRSDLAQRFNCVPSQINYVMSTRFSPERGYIVESRRGGNGYIRITRLSLSTADMIMHMVNGVGDALDGATARAMVQNMVQSGVLDRRSAELILAASSEKTLMAVPKELRDPVRAMLVKNMLLASRT